MEQLPSARRGPPRWRRYVLGYVVAYGLLVVAFGLGHVAGLDVVRMLRDPQAQTNRIGSQPWIGAVSMLGVMLWAFAAGCCLMAAWACAAARRRRDARFLGATGALLALLALDDGLVFHDHLGPRLLGSGAERVILAVLVLLMAAWAASFRDRFRSSDGVPVLFIVLCFGASLIIDVAFVDQRRALQIAEDGFKVAGIVTFAHAATVWCRSALGPIVSAGATSLGADQTGPAGVSGPEPAHRSAPTAEQAQLERVAVEARPSTPPRERSGR